MPLLTAASIWNTGAIGIAVAYGNIDIAIVLAVINFLTLWCLALISERFERTTDGRSDHLNRKVPPDRLHT